MACRCCCYGLRPIRLTDLRRELAYTQDERHQIALKHLEIKGTVRNSLCNIELFQIYKNIETDPIECEYVFPVENDTVVTGMSIHLPDGTILEATIEEETKATEMYQDAISDGNTAVMAKSTTPDRMVVNVGNVAPGAEVRIEFKFTAPIASELDFWRLYFPATLTPKAQSSDNSVEEVKQEVRFPLVRAKNCTYRIGMNIDIYAETPISDYSCKNYPFDWILSDDALHLNGRFKDGREYVPDTGIEILYKTTSSNVPICTIQERNGEYAAMLSFLPIYRDECEEIEDLQNQSGEFIFLIDRSGSMKGARIELAKQAAILFLKSLPPRSFFNIVSFGSQFEFLNNGSISYNSKNVDKVISKISAFQANMGGTNIYKPLCEIFNRQPNKDLPRSIFLLTDGEVSSPEAVVNLINQYSNSAVLHSIGIGSAVSSYLIKESARAGGGIYSFVTSLDELSKKVINALEKCLMPVLNDWKLDWEADAAPNIANIKRTYYGDRFILYAHLGNTIPNSMPKLQCYDSKIKSEREFNIPVDRAHIAPGDEIFKLWASNRISELEKSAYDISVKNNQIIRISKEYGIPSNLTSYICIQRNNEAVVGDMQLRRVPVARPKDMPQIAVSINTYQQANNIYRRCGGMKSFGMVRGAKSSLQDRGAPAMLKSSAAIRCEKPQSAVKCERRAKTSSKTLAMPRGKLSEKSAEQYEDEDVSSDIITADSGVYISLIKFQSTEGFWSFEQLIQLLNAKNEIPQEFSEIAEKEKIWGTLIALAYLRKNCAEKKDEWKLVERKSIRWLKSLVVPIEESIEKAIIFLN